MTVNRRADSMTGKTQMLSHVALLLIVSIGPIFASAPTHVATTNFAERLFRLSSEVADKLGWERLLIIRGYVRGIRALYAAFQLSGARSLPTPPKQGTKD